VLHVLEKLGVELGGAAFALGGGGVLVKRALEDGLTGKDCGDLIPFLRVLLVGAVEDAADGSLVT